MQAIKRTLGLTLVLIYLSACANLAHDTNVPLKTSPPVSLDQTMVPSPLETPSPASATGLEITSQAGLGTNPVNLEQTEAATSLSAKSTPGICQLDPVTQPPRPTKTLRSNELDEETGLHVTGRPQWIDLATYRLKVTGLVDHPLSLTYDDLRCLPKVTDNPELICPGVFTDFATWTGVPIKHILELAGVKPGATKLTLVSADGFEVQLLLEIASAEQNFLAYEVNGKLLPVEHGFPLRAVFPSLWGSYWLKWLVEIRIS